LFAANITVLCTQWVYVRGLSLALGETDIFVDIWLQISWYQNKELPMAIMSQFEHITLMA
jgi:hypothetical protein